MSLIEQIRKATQVGTLAEPFTVENIKDWITSAGIVKDDGEKYSSKSIDSILSNSDSKNIPTTNNNRKPLESSINSHGKKEYIFLK